MKAKLLLFFLLFCSIENALCQEYHPFLDNTTWIVRRTVSCCNPSIVRTISEGSEIMIGGYNYIAYNDPFMCGFDSNYNQISTVYVRENVSERKVYMLTEGVDTILYDFSMETGDTIAQYGYTWTATVDEVAVNTGMRKRITLRSVYSNGHELKQIWIEGIGTNKHPFYPTHNMTSFMSAGGGVMLNTTCVYHNGIHEFGDESCDALLSTSSEAHSTPKIVFSPNPVSTYITISSDLALQDASFKLYNANGKLVCEINNLNGKKISVNREKLSKGVYVAQLSEKGKLIKTGKVMLD